MAAEAASLRSSRSCFATPSHTGECLKYGILRDESTRPWVMSHSRAVTWRVVYEQT